MQIDWEAAEETLVVDRSVGPVSNITPGYKAAVSVLQEFCNKRIKLFGSKRNDPTINALSNLSPYFHFGENSVVGNTRIVVVGFVGWGRNYFNSSYQ